MSEISDDKDRDIVVDLNDTFHPYEDKNLREEQPAVPTTNKREPFNDYVKHQDIIQGYQRNRTLDDYPRSTRKWVKISAILILVCIVGSIAFSFYQSIHESLR